MESEPKVPCLEIDQIPDFGLWKYARIQTWPKVRKETDIVRVMVV